VSRVLSQLVLEDTLVVSIDESSFRTNNLSGRQWSLNRAAALKGKSETMADLKEEAKHSSPNTIAWPRLLEVGK